MFRCSIITIVVSVVLECMFREGLESATVADILIMLVSLIGMVYEAAIADGPYSFFSAETLAAELLRSFKCWRMFTLLVRHKQYFTTAYPLLCRICLAVEKVKLIMVMWATVILMLAIMNFHLQQSKMLLNGQG